MSQNIKAYRNDLDLLKGFAIIAVVLYHMGILRSGYLGVDTFFVINGFLIVPRVINSIGNNNFKYFPFLEIRIFRLLPLVLIASIICLLCGFWEMLPDDYENLSESVVATNFFSNNILASITSNDYWATDKEYMPLMHTWYIGILFEFYIVFPLIIMLVKWMSGMLRFGYYKYTVITIISLSILSVLLYLHSDISAGDKFYLLPYRFFEIAAGGLAGLWITNHHQNRLYLNGVASGICFVFLIAIMFFGDFSFGNKVYELNLVHGADRIVDSYIPRNILLLAVVSLTVFYVLSDNYKSTVVGGLGKIKLSGLLGMMSYSIYIWHQPILAFYRYLVSSSFPPLFIILFFIAVFAISYLSYKFVEQAVKINMKSRILVMMVFLITNAVAFTIYLNAGVVRDVPELFIQKNNVHRNLHAEYVDRIFKYDKDFSPSTSDVKIKVLVMGNSFGRDWCNILLESKMASHIDLSYIQKFEEKYINRIKGADYIFVFDRRRNVPYYVWENVKDESRVWGIGTKNFGESNGIIYKNRHRDDYFQQTVKIDQSFFDVNEELKKEWKDHYIDLMKLVMNKKGEIRVFTEDHKFMSQDCCHLSEGGAKFYAQHLDFSVYFDKGK